MRASAIIRIIVYIVVAVVCISLLIVGLVKGSLRGIRGINLGVINSGWGSDEGYTAAYEGEVNAKGLSRIDIDWISGLVTVEEYDGDTVKFWEENNSSNPDLQMRYMNANGTLNIHFARNGNINLGFDNVVKKLTVQVPRNLGLSVLKIDAVSSPVQIDGVSASKLEVDTASGNISVENISADVDIDTVSGDVSLKNVNADTVDIDSASGKHNLENVSADRVSLDSVSGDHIFSGLVRRISCNTTSGRITVACDGPIDDADFDTVSGDATIYLTDDTGFTARWDSVSGRFNCEFATKSSNNSATYGDGSASIKFNTVSGKMSIKER